MEHPFFQAINWGDVEDKRLTPPYIPNVKWAYNTSTQYLNSSNETTLKFEDKKERYLSSFSYYTEEKTERLIPKKSI